MHRWLRGTLWLAWGLWVVVCLGSFVLEVESPFYGDGISWVYWGVDAEIGWPSSSLVRWGLYHAALIAAPPVTFRILRRLARRGGAAGDDALRRMG